MGATNSFPWQKIHEECFKLENTDTKEEYIISIEKGKKFTNSIIWYSVNLFKNNLFKGIICYSTDLDNAKMEAEKLFGNP